jgi:hypothetical protein
MLRAFTLFGCILLAVSSFAQEKDVFDVFLVAGQSNTLRGCCEDPNRQVEDPLIKMLGRHMEEDMKIIAARNPMAHHGSDRDHISFAMTFAKLYRETELAEGRKVLIIHCGKGGSGFVDHRWNPGDGLYKDAVDRTKWVLENFPGSELKAILWQQGEKDVSEKNEDFRKDLDRMITSMRNEIKGDQNIIFLMGGMVPYWVGQKKSREDQQRYIRKTSDRLPNVWYVNPNQPFVIKKKDDKVDEIHYDAAGHKELGKRYFEKYLEAVKGVPQDTSEE